MNERIRTFIDTRVVPVEASLEPHPSGIEPGATDAADATRRRLRDEARRLGLWALALPAEHGGGGWSLAEYLAVAEVEGRSDHGPDVLGSSSVLTVRMLTRHAAPELRELLVPSLVSGAVGSCYAMTEPGAAGSDPASLRTSARRTMAGWRLSGRKWFITGAASARWAIVLARTDEDSPGRDAFSMFVVPAGPGGFEVVRAVDVLGAGGQYEMVFPEVTVPHSHLLGEVGQGLRLAGERIGLGRTLRALRWVGQAQRALELLAERLRTRRLADGVLGDQQLMQRLMFDSELAVRSARALTARAAALVAADRSARVEVDMAKVAAARALWGCVDAAIQAYGAEGLSEGPGLARQLRWARAARIIDGSEELLVSLTGRRLVREYAASP